MAAVPSSADMPRDATASELDDARRRRWRRRLCAAIALYAVWYVGTMRSKSSPRPWGSARALTVIAACARVMLGLLSVRLSMRWDGLEEGACPTASERLVTNDAAMFSIAPHGAYPLSMLALAVPAFQTDERLKSWKLRLAGASVLYQIPVVRELLLLLGGREATASTMHRCFADGCSVAVNPGGIYEQVHTDHTQEQIFVQKRLGFIRMAMAAGKPIIPTYCFGENQLFRTHRGLARPLQMWMLRKLRIGLPIFTGRWGVPFGPPLPTSTTLVVGREVDVGSPNPDPTDREVDEVFGRYVAELQRLFDKYAFQHLPAEVAMRGLRIERIGDGPVALPASASVPESAPVPRMLGAILGDTASPALDAKARQEGSGTQHASRL